MLFEEDKRIKEFQKLMSPHVTTDFNEWLIRKSFFIVPASVGHHGAYTGGLFDHSLAVTRSLLSLTEKLDLKWGRECSPYIVGMFHDLCKIDSYIMNDEGRWVYKENPLLAGHGDKSVIMLQQHMQLTEEEICCIRWHMGAFDDKKFWNYYGQAVTEYPNVLYTHTADMMAARILGI